jgi:hypothetical protein
VTRDDDDDDDACTVVSNFTPTATDRFRLAFGSFIRTRTVSLRDTLPKIFVMGHVVQRRFVLTLSPATLNVLRDFLQSSTVCYLPGYEDGVTLSFSALSCFRIPFNFSGLVLSHCNFSSTLVKIADILKRQSGTLGITVLFQSPNTCLKFRVRCVVFLAPLLPKRRHGTFELSQPSHKL